MAVTYTTTNHPAMRQSNQVAVLRTLYDSAPIARVDIAHRTGLNAKTVSRIVDELLDHGLVRELGFRTAASAGRRAVELEVDPLARFVLAVDVAPPHVTAALVDLSGVVHHQFAPEPTPEPWDVSETIAIASHATHAALQSVPAEQREHIVGVGIGAPGRFKVSDGRYYGLFGAKSAAWLDLGAAQQIGGDIGLPITIDNNANTSALAELWFGQGKGISDFVLLNVGRGLGMGIVIDGEVYRGGNHNAGEAGHITVDVNGPECNCGNPGCLAVFLSPRHLARTVAERVAAGEGPTRINLESVTLPSVIDAWHAGDGVAASVMDDVHRYLCAGLVSIINTCDPAMVLIGRELAGAGDPFFDRVRETMRSRLNAAVAKEILIEPAKIGNAPLLGAATLALQEFFRAPLTRPTMAGVR